MHSFPRIKGLPLYAGGWSWDWYWKVLICCGCYSFHWAGAQTPCKITSQARGLWWSICWDYKVSTQNGIVARYSVRSDRRWKNNGWEWLLITSRLLYPISVTQGEKVTRQLPVPWTQSDADLDWAQKFSALKPLRIWLKMKSTESGFRSSHNEITASTKGHFL